MKDARSGKPGTETLESERECIHKVELSGLQVASNQGKERLAGKRGGTGFRRAPKL